MNVYYANYLYWYEQARIEFLRSVNINYKDLEASGLGLPIAKVICNYKAELHLDDEFVVITSISELTKWSITFYHQLVVDTKVVNIATIKAVLVDLQTKKLAQWPSDIYKILERLEEHNELL
jgi:acyl-CoA thioester hydrolase